MTVLQFCPFYQITSRNQHKGEKLAFHMLDKPAPTISCSPAGFYMVYTSNLQLGEGEQSVEAMFVVS